MPTITPEYLASQHLNLSFPRRFWAKVRKTEGCWVWTAATCTFGYGHLSTRGKHGGLIDSHRASWILHFGPVPPGLCVLHNCPGGDNPRCVNPSHLWLGTHADNGKDRDTKGRSRYRTFHGADHGGSKLTDRIVLEMREVFSRGRISIAALGRKFGTSESNASRIVKRQAWRHLLQTKF
jgi:hypothetical protein